MNENENNILKLMGYRKSSCKRKIHNNKKKTHQHKQQETCQINNLNLMPQIRKKTNPSLAKGR